MTQEKTDVDFLIRLAEMKIDDPDRYKEIMKEMEGVMEDYTSIAFKIANKIEKSFE